MINTREQTASFYSILVLALLYAILVCIPVVKVFPTLFGAILFLITAYKFRWHGLATEVRMLFGLSVAFFTCLFLIDIWAGPTWYQFDKISAMTQFFYLPFAFAVLSLVIRDLSIERIARLCFWLILTVCVLAVLEKLLVKEPLIWAPFGREGGNRYIYLGTGSWPRVSLLVGNALTFSNIAAPLVFASFVGFWQMEKRARFARLGLLILGFIVFVGLTQNRGSLLSYSALTVILGIYLIATADQYYRGKIIKAVAGACVFIGIFGTIIILTTETRLEVRMASAINGMLSVLNGQDINTIAEKSFKLRMDFFQASFVAIREHPWAGYGASEIMSSLNPYFVTDTAREAKHLQTPHSLILNNLIAGGIVSTSLLFAVLLYPTYRGVKLMRAKFSVGVHWLYLGLALFVAIFVDGLTNNIFYDDHKNTAYLTYLFLIVIGMAQARHALEATD